ncbi:unnamed protein product [Trifolium pratense]|uniref:Uncharacterized protein n=1 Tax=Trifolium pratense TaxID=57577 RepID=A0ACB0LXY6_TRIPR|nr:unnamed protein product [Trifolium pratense]
MRFSFEKPEAMGVRWALQTDIAQHIDNLIIFSDVTNVNCIAKRTALASIELIAQDRRVSFLCVLLNNGNGTTICDGTDSSKDPLHEIGGPMTRSKTMRMNQALQSLVIKIKEKEDRYPSEAEPTWLNFLQLDEDA